LAMRARMALASASSSAALTVRALFANTRARLSRLPSSSFARSRHLGPRFSHSATRACSAAVTACRLEFALRRQRLTTTLQACRARQPRVVPRQARRHTPKKEKSPPNLTVAAR
jgi:hypothetical protein